jgi:uncharacterized protein YheU (UPF0270 family)
MYSAENAMILQKTPVTIEDGIIVPYMQIDPDTLNRMIEEFVTREWSSLSDDCYTLDDKVEQVLSQLKNGMVQVVFDLTTQSANLSVVRRY